MKRILLLLFILGGTAVWCSSSFAQRQSAVGPGIIPLNALGELNGVDISGFGTLSVGVPGGPRTDIFTSNNPPLPGLVAVSTAVSSQGDIVFNSSSTVFGAIGVTQPGGPFLLNISGGNNGTAVNFQGAVFATTLNVTGTGAVNFNSGSTNITATNFAADGTISLAPNTIVIGALTTTAGANTGHWPSAAPVSWTAQSAAVLVSEPLMWLAGATLSVSALPSLVRRTPFRSISGPIR